MLATLNFYNENVIISLPKTFYEFKLIIVEKYMIGIDDLNKLIFLCDNKEISNEEQYQKIISLNKRITIFIQVSEKSKIHNTEEKYSIKKIEEKEKLEDEKEENIIENIINTKIGNKKEESEDEKEVIHKNVRCDGCKKYPIIGIRYKCTICHNFDYCEECEKKFNEEHNHPFLKIRKPELAHFAYEYMRKKWFKY